MGEEGKEMLARSVAYWDRMYKEITEKLHNNDLHMVKCYLLNILTGIDIHCVFVPGDYVLLRCMGGHKLSK